VEQPATHSIIGKGKTVQSKEMREGKEERMQHAKLYLRSFSVHPTSAPPGLANSDLLHFTTSISTFNNQGHSAYY